jgi:hypothetical protein
MPDIMRFCQNQIPLPDNPLALERIVTLGRSRGLISDTDEPVWGLLNYLYSEKQGELIHVLRFKETGPWISAQYDHLKNEID